MYVTNLIKKTFQTPRLEFDDLESIDTKINKAEYDKSISIHDIYGAQTKEHFTRRNPSSDAVVDISKFKVFTTFATTILSTTKQPLTDDLENCENIHPNRGSSKLPNSNKHFLSAACNNPEGENRHNSDGASQHRVRTDLVDGGGDSDKRFHSSRSVNQNSPTDKLNTVAGSYTLHATQSNVSDVNQNSSLHDKDELEDEDVIETLFSKVRHNRIEYVRQALNRGQDCNVVDRNGNTMLHICGQNNNKQIAAMLLDNKQHNCDINAKNLKGLTVLDYAEKYGFDKLATFLIGRGALRFNESSSRY